VFFPTPGFLCANKADLKRPQSDFIPPFKQQPPAADSCGLSPIGPVSWPCVDGSGLAREIFTSQRFWSVLCHCLFGPLGCGSLEDRWP